MQDAYADLASPALGLAAEAGASYYDLAGGEGKVAEIVPEAALRKTARWAMSSGNATTGLQLLSGSLEGHIYSAAQDSVQQSAEAEPGATWARRARRDACPWCRMVATRGDVYASAKSATQHSGVGRHMADQDGYHDFCRCLGVAVRPGQVYRAPSYVEEWEEQYKLISSEVGPDPRAVVKAWEALLDDDHQDLVAASSQKYDDEAYLRMTPDEKKKERARRRREAAKKKPAPTPTPAPQPAPAPTPPTVRLKYDDEAYRRMSPEEKKKERARRRKLLAQNREVAPAPSPVKPPEKKVDDRSTWTVTDWERELKRLEKEFWDNNDGSLGPEYDEFRKQKAEIYEALKTAPYDPGKELFRRDDPMEMFDAREGANPHNREGWAYQVNCQRVAPSYELRRRGYNVQAGKRTKSNGLDDNEINQYFLDPKTKRPRDWEVAEDWARLVKQCEKHGPKARGFLIVNWQSGGAHIMNWEITPGGSVVFVEGQLNYGEVYRGSTTHRKLLRRNDDIAPRISWDRTNYRAAPGKKGAWVMRIDDQTINWNAMKKYKSSVKAGAPA